MLTYTPTASIERAMFGLGYWELLIVLLLVLVVFGAGKLPTVGSSLGEGIRNFKGALKGEIKSEDKKKLEADKEVAQAKVVEPEKESVSNKEG